MADEIANTTTDSTTCKVCCSPIPPKARKCIKCGSYQDWTRHLLRLGVVVGGFLTLTPLWNISKSLTTLVTPQQKAAKLQVAVAGCTADEVRVFFENNGQISGIVTGLRFAVVQAGKRSEPEVEIRRNAGEQDIIVSPQQQPVKASYHAYIDGTPASLYSRSDGDGACIYQLEFAWLDFAGTRKTLEATCPCP